MRVTLRSRGRISESERIIIEFLNGRTFELNDESHRVLGLLSLSQANNRIYRFDFRTDLPETCLPPCGHTLGFSNSNHAYLWATDVQIGNAQLHLIHESATNTLRRGMVDIALHKRSQSVGEKLDDV